MQRFSNYFLFFATATVLFLSWVAQLVIDAQRASPVRLGSGFGWAMGIYLALMVGWVVALVFRFRRPSPDHSGGLWQ